MLGPGDLRARRWTHGNRTGRGASVPRRRERGEQQFRCRGAAGTFECLRLDTRLCAYLCQVLASAKRDITNRRGRSQHWLHHTGSSDHAQSDWHPCVLRRRGRSDSRRPSRQVLEFGSGHSHVQPSESVSTKLPRGSADLSCPKSIFSRGKHCATPATLRGFRPSKCDWTRNANCQFLY